MQIFLAENFARGKEDRRGGANGKCTFSLSSSILNLCLENENGFKSKTFKQCKSNAIQRYVF